MSYKKPTKTFMLALILFLTLILFNATIFDKIVKTSNIYGENFNSEREYNKLNKNWKIDSLTNEKFRIHWYNTKSPNYEKILKFGYFGPITETDYYQSKTVSSSTYYSIYYFDKKNIKFYSEMCAVVGVQTEISKEEFILKTKK